MQFEFLSVTCYLYHLGLNLTFEFHPLRAASYSCQHLYLILEKFLSFSRCLLNFFDDQIIHNLALSRMKIFKQIRINYYCNLLILVDKFEISSFSQ